MHLGSGQLSDTLQIFKSLLRSDTCSWPSRTQENYPSFTRCTLLSYLSYKLRFQLHGGFISLLLYRSTSYVQLAAQFLEPIHTFHVQLSATAHSKYIDLLCSIMYRSS